MSESMLKSDVARHSDSTSTLAFRRPRKRPRSSDLAIQAVEMPEEIKQQLCEWGRHRRAGVCSCSNVLANEEKARTPRIRQKWTERPRTGRAACRMQMREMTISVFQKATTNDGAGANVFTSLAFIGLNGMIRIENVSPSSGRTPSLRIV